MTYTCTHKTNFCDGPINAHTHIQHANCRDRRNMYQITMTSDVRLCNCVPHCVTVGYRPSPPRTWAKGGSRPLPRRGARQCSGNFRRECGGVDLCQRTQGQAGRVGFIARATVPSCVGCAPIRVQQDVYYICTNEQRCSGYLHPYSLLTCLASPSLCALYPPAFSHSMFDV